MSDHETGREYFTMIPNIVMRLELSVYGLGLYAHIVSTAGWDGECWKSSRTLAKELRCSTGTITNAKRELQRKHCILGFKPLIEIRPIPGRHGGKAYHLMTPVPIWAENKKYFAARLARSAQSRSVHELPCSTSALGSSSGDVAGSSGEIKKIASKNNIIEEAAPSLSPSSRENEKEAVSISEFWSFLCKLFDRSTVRSPARKEKKLLLHWSPVPPKEYKLIEWWMGINENGYDNKQGVGFHLRRRPRSIGAILENWGSVNDVARYYWTKKKEQGVLR